MQANEIITLTQELHLRSDSAGRQQNLDYGIGYVQATRLTTDVWNTHLTIPWSEVVQQTMLGEKASVTIARKSIHTH
jgi:hypothetical protein